MTRWHWSGRRVARILLILVAAILLLGLAWGVTLTHVWGRMHPQTALTWWPYGSQTRAELATNIIKSRPSPSGLARARELSEGVLQREPVNVAAARNLGLIAASRRDLAKAQRLFRYAESLSRRDAPTQLWLLEAAAARNDIDGTLRHYDRALRTSRGLHDLLIPILVSASAEPPIARSLARMMAERPPWWRNFANKLISEGTSGPSIALIVGALELDPRDPAERFLLGSALTRVASLGGPARAWDMYRAAKGGAAVPPGLLRDGEFEAELRLPPFDWLLVDRTEFAAIAEPSPQGGRGQVLNLYSTGASGEVARQMLLLRSGSYRLSARVGSISGDELARPVISLVCAGRADAELLALRLPAAAADGVAIQREFSVPAACPIQWIAISTGSSVDRASSPPWIDSVSVRPS